MNRAKLSVLFGSAWLACTAVVAADLTAAQLAERNAAARGGLDAWRAVNTMTMSGEMDAGGKKDARLPFVMSLKRPHKSRLEIRFQDQNAVQTYDGRQGWKLRPFLGRTEAEPLSATELRSVASADDLDGPLIDHARKGSRIELQGMETVEGRKTYKLQVTTADGASRHLWIDASSFLEVKIDGEPRKLDGRPHKVTVFYRDFKAVGGLKIPHTLETVVEGVKATRKISIKNVAVNPRLDDTLFAKPTAGPASAL